MSNAIRYDPLLVHYLARELDERLRNRSIAAAPVFASDLSVRLPLGGGEQLRLDLHPTRGWVRILPDPHQSPDDLDAHCAGVEAPLDERLIRIRIETGDRFRDHRRTLLIELHTNQWNALLVGDDGRIQSVLRARHAGTRALFPGEPYTAPPGSPRFGADQIQPRTARERWREQIEAARQDERRARLLAGFAWTGATNADWILGGDGGPAAFERWWWLRSLPAPAPAVISNGIRRLPYPLPLDGTEADRQPSLLAAMERIAEVGDGPRVDPALAAAESFARARAAAARRRVDRLVEEGRSADEADRLQATGDLLLGRLHQVPRGVAEVTLESWEGEEVTIELDPALTPAENAARYYATAGRKRRAAAQLPALLHAAEEEVERWRRALLQIEAGEVPSWVESGVRERAARGAGPGEGGTSLPYRVYRTSGGLEVRVGRSARDNDRLTFHASSPNDVWLHARSVPGSHIILRWPDPEGAPPARDLAEAATLAALFSRARTSGTVAVDWTRRKYVRKPRGAPAGAVVPQRVKTIFVEPDEALADRLQVKDD